jgi:hypothetical protein
VPILRAGDWLLKGRRCHMAGLMLAGVLCGGCAPGEPVAQAPRVGPACSAAGTDVSAFTDHPALTGPANATRRMIVSEAVACDYEGLAAIAGADFTYSFGVPGDPAAFWRGLEESGEPALWYLVTLLRLDPQLIDTGSHQVYTWPRTYADDADAARVELERLFGADTVNGWYAPEGYLGWRVGIRRDGAWSFFVAGD